MLVTLLIVTVLVLLAYKIYKWGTKNDDLFLNKGIKFIKPTFLVGNTGKIWMRKATINDYVNYVYNFYPNEKLIGIFDMLTPIVLVRHPEAVKQIAVKEFDNFSDHQAIIDEEMDPLFGNSLISLKGQKWRDMRATLSPAFTGSKMRLMFELVSDCSEQMVKYFNKEIKDKGPQSYEMKEIFSRLTNDIIASCAFGIKVDSLESQENEFFMTGKNMMAFNKPLNIIRFIGIRACPKLMKYFKIPLIRTKLTNFFRSIILETMLLREKKKIFRPDMIQLLMEARKGILSNNVEENDSAGFATVDESDIGKKTTKREWNDDEIIAQCFLFFLAGFETTSTVLSFTCYEIGTNPEVQEKLFQEVKEVSEDLKGKKLTYDIIQKMKYLDMVISETLRKWPPAPVTDRICANDFEYNDGEGVKYKFEKGNLIWIPIIGFHFDPKYFPNPDKFDPERFSDENKDKINPAAYLPFGVGPRNCIGSRFALMEVKAIIYHLILNFSLEVTEKTQIPLKLAKVMAGLPTEKGVWFELRSRN